MSVLRRLYRYLLPYKAWAAVAFVAMITVAATNGALVTLVQPLFDEVLTMEKVEQSADEKASTARKTRAIDFILERHKPPEERSAWIRWIDRIIEPAQRWWNEHEHDRYRYVLAAVLLVFVIRAISAFFSEYAFEKVGLSTIRDLRNAVYESIIHQSNRFFSKRPTGELVSRIVSDADAVQAAVSIRMGDLFQESANLLVLIALVLLRNTELAVVSLGVGLLIVIPVVQFGKRLRKATHI